MKKIMTLFIAVALIASFGIGAIAGANEDAFANAVIEEQTQLVLEKAAIEFAQGHDAEGLALEGAATNNFGKTKLDSTEFLVQSSLLHTIGSLV